MIVWTLTLDNSGESHRKGWTKKILGMYANLGLARDAADRDFPPSGSAEARAWHESYPGGASFHRFVRVTNEGDYEYVYVRKHELIGANPPRDATEDGR